MRPRRSTVLGSAVSVLLVGAGAGAFYLTPPDHGSQFDVALGMVKEMHQIASQWAVETSRVLADHSSNFDSISAFVPQVHTIRSEFSETVGSLPVSQQVAADARAYVAALDALAERVERFKTAYSAIRNSERYFPLASETLVEQALDAGDEPLAQELQNVTGALARYVTVPSDADAQRLLARIQLLSGRLRPDSPLKEPLQSYVAHAHVVLAERERVETHFDKVTSNDLMQRTTPLTAALEMEQIAHANQVSLYRQGGLAAGAGVAVVWIIVGLIRRRRTSPPPLHPTEPVPGADTRERGRDAPPAAGVPAAGGAETHTPDIETRTPDIVEAMIGCGALPGLMGQTFAVHARRLLADLDSVHPAGKGAVAPEWARMRSDVRLLGFLAERMTVLGRHLAPKHLADIDINAVITERLAGREVTPVRLLRPVPHIKAPRVELELLVDACVEWALHCLRGLAPHDAELTVSTRPYDAGVEFALIHNGGWLPPERGHTAFVPFATSRSPRTGLVLPAVRYLARRLGGTASMAVSPNGQSRLTVRLPAELGA